MGGACLLGIDRGESLLRDARRRLTKCFVELDRPRKFLENERVAPSKLNVGCKRLRDAIGVATAQGACRIPGTKSKAPLLRRRTIWKPINAIR